MRLVRATPWFIGFVVVSAITFVSFIWLRSYFPSVGRSLDGVILIGAPGMLAFLLLLLVVAKARRRLTVVLCSVIAGLLVLAQCFVFWFSWEYNKGFWNIRFSELFLMLLAACPVVGTISVGMFARYKLNSISLKASSSVPMGDAQPNPRDNLEQTTRKSLLVSSALLLGLLTFLILYVITESGISTFGFPRVAYGTMAPAAYLLFCLGTTLNWFPARWLRRLGVFAHLAAAPAVIISVMNIGFLLPLVAILWLRVYRASVNTHPS
jgi:hypothetical protein